MFTWLRSLFCRNRSGFYRPAERLIYSYWTGEKVIHADPQLVLKRIMEHGPELSVDLRVGRSSIKGAKESHDRALQTIREAFGIKPPSKENPLDCSTTLTELEVEELLDHFLLWTDELKKNTNQQPTSPTETSPTTPQPVTPSTGENPATKNTLDSGSIENVSSIEGLTRLPSEQGSPSEPSNPDLTISEPLPTEKGKP